MQKSYVRVVLLFSIDKKGLSIIKVLLTMYNRMEWLSTNLGN